MLGVLLRRPGVNGAVNRLYQEVGRGVVGQRAIEFEIDLGSGHHLIDEECSGIGVQVGGNRSCLGLVLQPDERDIVVLNEAARAGAAVIGVSDGDDPWIGSGALLDRKSRNQVREVARLIGFHGIDR